MSNANVRREVDELLAALEGMPQAALGLHRALCRIDRHAADVLFDRIREYATTLGPGYANDSSPSYVLNQSFEWRRSPEGYDYWATLYKELP